MKPKSVIIIGAGVGGMTAAIHLAKSGLHVTVLEKNAGPGGRCGRLVRDGHLFDTGPTLFVMPLLYASEFHALGISMHEELGLQRVDPTYRLMFDDGRRLDLTSDMKSMRDQLDSMQPGSFQGLMRYLREGDEHYRLVVDNLVTRDFRNAFDFFNPQTLSAVLRIKPFSNHYRNMSAYFNEPRLKNAFTFQDMYMGLSPFDAPATFSLMPYSEMAHGVWYPKGGMYRVAETLAEVGRNAGVEFAFTTAVERIEVQGTRARGVRLAGGSSLPADIVLANADLPYVYRDLLPHDGMIRTLSRKEYSCSVINFFWGTDKRYESLGPHTLFLADDYRENFESIIRDLSLPANPTIYLHAPVRLDSSMAPPGCDSLTATVPVGHINERGGQDWEAIRSEARGHVLRRLRTLGIADLEAHIKVEETFTPPGWAERYNLVKGSTHGLSHRLTQLACFRPSNRHSRYTNLFFVGASTHPGTGLPTTMVSGRLVSKRIRQEQH
jgi:phytoene desaturase